MRQTDSITYAKLYDSALRSLARRDHSQRELREKLQRKHRGYVLMSTDGCSGNPDNNDPSLDSNRQPVRDAVDVLLAELQEQGLLSDERFAEALVRSRLNRGYGPNYVRQELRGKGVVDDIVDQVMQAAEGQWQDGAEHQVERRFPAAGEDRSVWLKAARFLQRRGFSSDHINHVLGRMPLPD